MSDLPAGIVTQLKLAQQGGNSLAGAVDALVLQEDVHDLATEISKATGKIGMLILVGMPHGTQTMPMQSPNINLKLSLAIGIGEEPIVWRKAGRPTAPAVAQIVAQLVQNLKLDGIQYIKVDRIDYVPDPKRQIYEVGIEAALVAPKLEK